MQTELTLKEIHAKHPEFIFGNKVYRYSYASGDWLYLDNRNQWRVVPKNWTHIIRQLPYAEQMEIEREQMHEARMLELEYENESYAYLKRLEIGRKGAKPVGSKIAKRYERNKGGVDPYAACTEPGDVRTNRRKRIRGVYVAMKKARARHAKLGGRTKGFYSYWLQAIKVMVSTIKGDKAGAWPVKTFKV